MVKGNRRRHQCGANAEIGRPHEAGHRRQHENEDRIEHARQRQQRDGRGDHAIGRAHAGEQIAMADAVADRAEHRGDERADIDQRRKQRQKQHRSGLDQDVPAENDRLHLERP
jgi:hypothetical protein